MDKSKRPQGTENLNATHEHRIERDGGRDLTFKGWLIGEGSHGTGGNSGYESDWTRGVKVYVYLTTGGNLVTAAERWSRWQGEGGICTAASHKSPSQALAWLKGDSSKGTLGPASKEAWENACDTWGPLKGQDVERVE